ncbi:Adenosine deaminase [Psychrobacter aquaticus CMS 56]|uniref:Adenine deaminase n=2 Tax=Psychrobacter TaxID=497 RepID=U4T4U7_9GAMM|nr:Adenosine deaminase [Psychrobacter aquaticus CMS 56]
MSDKNYRWNIMIDLIKKLPKAELHLHIEGSLEPELMFRLAKKNQVEIPYKSIEDVRNAYNFTNLQTFLDIYYAGANVLITKEDFYDLTWEYILKCVEDNVIHTEIFFDPQTHTERGVPFEAVITGIKEALADAKEKYGITSCIIMCFLRHLSQEEAFDTLEEALKFKNDIIGVGLDSSELGNPPSKFKEVFKKAKEEGFKLVAHAGEEADFSYIYEALDLLNINRIDHGVQSIKSPELMQRLKIEQMPLTVCPNSNIELKVFENYKEHNIKELLDYGLNISVNSDDPAYFKGYINQNFINLHENLPITEDDIITLVKNSFRSAFIDDELKEAYLAKVDLALQ